MKRHALLLLGCVLLAACQHVPEQSEHSLVPQHLVSMPADARTRAQAHTELAAAYYELGNMGVALEEARIAVSADPSYAPAHNVQGLVHMELREPAAAEQSFRRGLQLAPQDPDLNHNYGWFLCQTGRAAEATPWFMKAVKDPLYRTPARSYAAAGRCIQQNDPAAATGFYERALQLEPNSPGTLLSYAELRYRQGELDEARNLLRRHARLVQEPSAEALWLGLRVERKLGDRAAAGRYAAQLRRHHAGSSQYQALQRGQYD